MIFLYNKHSNMRICWTCEIWNDHSLLSTGPQNSNTAGKGDDTHTHTPMSLLLSHTHDVIWIPMECDEIRQLWLAEEAGSEHIPQTFQITTPQTTNENHRHSRTEPIRVLAHDESSRDWINNGGRLKQPYQHCPRRQTKHLLSRNRFYTTRGGITSALWC